MKKVMIGTMTHPKQDHFDTPEYAVKPLLPYLNKKWRYWEPTDTYGRSGIAEALTANKFKVVTTKQVDIDFLKDDAPFKYDCIITNPPFSQKDAFIKRCIDLGKPWAMLLPITALEGVQRGKLFKACDVELLVLDRRVEFMNGSVRFNTSWFCCFILPENLMFAELKKE